MQSFNCRKQLQIWELHRLIFAINYDSCHVMAEASNSSDKTKRNKALAIYYKSYQRYVFTYISSYTKIEANYREYSKTQCKVRQILSSSLMVHSCWKRYCLYLGFELTIIWISKKVYFNYCSSAADYGNCDHQNQ